MGLLSVPSGVVSLLQQYKYTAKNQCGQGLTRKNAQFFDFFHALNESSIHRIKTLEFNRKGGYDS